MTVIVGARAGGLPSDSGSLARSVHEVFERGHDRIIWQHKQMRGALNSMRIHPDLGHLCVGGERYRIRFTASAAPTRPINVCWRQLRISFGW
jgi:hypothetical protein